MTSCSWGTADIKGKVRKFLKEIDLERLRGILRSLDVDDVPAESRGAHQLAETAILKSLQQNLRPPAHVLTLESVTSNDIIVYFKSQFKVENLNMPNLTKWSDKKLQDTVLKLWVEGPLELHTMFTKAGMNKLRQEVEGTASILPAQASGDSAGPSSNPGPSEAPSLLSQQGASASGATVGSLVGFKHNLDGTSAQASRQVFAGRGNSDGRGGLNSGRGSHTSSVGPPDPAPEQMVPQAVPQANGGRGDGGKSTNGGRGRPNPGRGSHTSSVGPPNPDDPNLAPGQVASQDEDALVKLVCQQARAVYEVDLERTVRKEHDAQCKLFQRLYNHDDIQTVKTEKIIAMQIGGRYINEVRCDIILNEWKGHTADLIVELKVAKGLVPAVGDATQVVDYMKRLNVQQGLLLYFPHTSFGHVVAATVKPNHSLTPFFDF